ncbi:MAG: Crp/Fnr family transcriptional regulator [Sulfuricaulis sp.]|nr:Crp/Fnr family transcriptional regulator [Sulfuricaulis sp.]
MLENVPLFSGLRKQELVTIDQHTVAKTFPAHTTILREKEKSDSLYIILYGKVKVYVSEKDGNEVILNIQGRGDFFGEMALLDDAPRSASVMTMEPTRLTIMTKAAFRECLAAHPDIAYALIRMLTQRVRALTENVRNLALLDVYGRVARTLLHLAAPSGDKLIVEQKLTHQEIANMVGASREMVSRILKDLANKGHITVERKRITINEKLSTVC